MFVKLERTVNRPFMEGDAPFTLVQSSLSSSSSLMANAVQRPLKGSRISTFYPVKTLPALSTLDSAFQLQEFISLTIRLNIHDVSAIISVPDSRTNAEGGSEDSNTGINDEGDGDKDSRGEFAVDEACWIYEQLRFVPIFPCLDTNP